MTYWLMNQKKGKLPVCHTDIQFTEEMLIGCS